MMQRRQQLRARALRRSRIMTKRRRLVAELLELYPSCTAQLDGCDGRAVDVHEVVSRARGGDLLDERVCVTLCRRCHDVVPQLVPETAAALGLLFPSGTDPAQLVRLPTGELRLESDVA